MSLVSSLYEYSTIYPHRAEQIAPPYPRTKGTLQISHPVPQPSSSEVQWHKHDEQPKPDDGNIRRHQYQPLDQNHHPRSHKIAVRRDCAKSPLTALCNTTAARKIRSAS